MEFPTLVGSVLLLLLPSLSKGQEKITELTGFDGYAGDCNKGNIETLPSLTLEGCAATCLTTWRCYGFVYTGDLCRLKYEQCHNNINSDITGALTYINKNPMKKYPGNDSLCEAHGVQCVPPECCPYMYEAEDICTGYPERRCCLHPPDCDWKNKEKDLSYWMAGSYSLPRSAYDCPDTSATPWIRTKVEILISDPDANNSLPEVTRLPGPFSGQRITLTSCTQSEDMVPMVYRVKQHVWPRGSYCIYKTLENCPGGLNEGTILINNAKLELFRYTKLEPVVKAANGSLMIKFCCRNDGPTITAIRFPTPSPFSLLKSGAECQNVLYMEAASDNIQLDFGDSSTIQTFGQLPYNIERSQSFIQLDFCHYKEYETCHYEMDNGRSYHGYLNLTKSGTCKIFSNHRWWDNQTYPELMGIVVKNHCTGMRSQNPKPFCYPESEKYEKIQACVIPFCPDFRQEMTISSRGRSLPSRQMVGPLSDAVLPIDIYSSTTCSKQDGFRPWWQLDLQRAETVIGLTTDDNSGRYCTFTGLDIYVGMQPDDFYHQEEFLCIKAYWGYGTTLQLRCLRPLVGQYITIRQGLRSRESPGEMNRCLNLCDVKVFTKESTCGSTLGHRDLDPSSQVKVSSSETPSGVENVILYSLGSWCAAPTDTKPYLQVDLLKTWLVTGFWTQGSPDTTIKYMVTHFTLTFGLLQDEMISYEENDQVKVFVMGSNPGKPVRHDLSMKVSCRYLRFTITKWQNKPCFRFSIIACKFTQVNQVSSVPWQSEGGYLLQDGRRETCMIVTDRRWSVALASEINILDIILRLQNSYSFNVEVWVTSDMNAPESDTNKWTLCGKQKVTSSILGMRCDVEPIGKRVLFVLESENDISVCEVEVYGGNSAVVRSSPYKTGKTVEVTCASDQVAQVLAFKKALEPYDLQDSQKSNYINISQKVMTAAGAWCDGQTHICSVRPDLFPGPSIYALLGCVPTFTPDPVCSTEVTSPGQLLLTDDYLRLYRTSALCFWLITPPSGKFVKLTITEFNLQKPERTFMDGSHFVNVGTCQDTLSVGYVRTGYQNTDMMEVEGKQTFISPEGGLIVSLKTCFQYRYVPPEVSIDMEVEFSGCFGCAVLSECSGQVYCDQPCGVLQSPKFPLNYTPNRKCSWRITVAQDAYINLKFNEFDIYEEKTNVCGGDAVELFDFDSSGKRENLLGRYCNTYLPPEQVESGWNVLRVDFYTNGQNARKGFTATYEAVTHDFTESIAWSENSKECKEGWIFVEGICMRVFNLTDTVTWLQAESECSHQGANLATIHSEAEMTFLNFLLISKYQITEVYIGLTDREQEGLFKWQDGFPLTYTNWQKHEPNGGAIEDCSVVSLAGVRAQPSWKDISCAAATVKHFICSYSTTGSTHDQGLVPVVVSPGEAESCGGGQMFQCSTGECIHAVLQCDGARDCLNGTDERHCGSSCKSTSFTCDDGQCVSLTFVCDGRRHCLDGSDETWCDYPPCEVGDFRCKNGECISGESRCDLVPDCSDGSDELDCTSCSANRTYQCYDGTCVSKARICDSYYDCPGQLQEDESSAACSSSFPQTCLDWRRKGYVENRRYDVQIPGYEEMSVSCDMTSFPNQVVTIIHHSHEAPNNTFHGFEPPASYRKNISYFGPLEAILTIRELSHRCEQFMEGICQDAGAFARSWFVGADKNKHWYYDDVNNDGCRCRLDKVCKERPDDTLCYCSHPNAGVTHVDRGYFTQKSVLPVLELTMEDTGNAEETMFYTIGPLRCYQRFDEGALTLKRCKNGQLFTATELCLYSEDGFGVPKNCRDATHLENCESHQCPKDYFKCPNSFCLAASNVCDGKPNCRNGEDEIDCALYECPGMMKCQGQRNCVPISQLCDGHRQCPMGDDEWYCDVKCPGKCSCTGLTYLCRNGELQEIPSGVSAKARKLELSDNDLDLAAMKSQLSKMKYLVELLMARNSLNQIPSMYFANLSNLRLLDISENNINALFENTFVGLMKLRVLNLKYNPLTYISPNAFEGLRSLPELDISEMKLTNISYGVFGGMASLENLDMSKNEITKLERGIFDDLKQIKHIKMHDNLLKDFIKDDFAKLTTLQTMHSDDFMFCCFVNIQDENCLPPKDLLSSCEDLMENNILRSFLWILGSMAFAGNIFVLLYRSASKDRDRVPSMLIRNLAAGDLLMGLYMLVIASVDLYYRGVYIENAMTWKESILCQILGCLSTVASEASVFTLGFITVDRLINILFPLSTWKLTQKSARYVIATIWFIVIIIAAIPLIPGSYFQGVFYSRSGVCVSLYITSEQTPGWEYSFFIFHGLNLSVFIFIFFAYGYMYQIIKKAGAMGAGEQKKREMAAARKMTIIVVTDFCCWVPINIMGFLALSGTQIPGVIYAWTVVFILPVNSALNPVLYTISSITFPWQKGSEKATDMSVSLVTERTRVVVGLNEKDQGVNTLDSWMKSREVASIGSVFKLTQQMAQLLQNLHYDGLYLGQLNAQSVYVDQEKDGKGVSFSGYPQMASLNAEGPAIDMEIYGKIISRLLRASAIARKERV